MKSPYRKFWLLLILLTPLFLAGMSPAIVAQAASNPLVPVEVESENGYARLIFKWQGLTQTAHPPAHSATIRNGVLVIHFDRRYDLDFDELRDQTEDYIALIRQDNDGQTVRMALKYSFQLQSNADQMDVAIDLIPESYNGTPPAHVAPRPAIDLDLLVVTGELRKVPTAAELRQLQVAATPLPLDSPRLPVRVIRSDVRSRVVFQWPDRVGYDVVREGDTVVLNFNEIARPKLVRLRVDPPRFVKTADAVKRLGGLEVRVEVDPEADFHHFREANDIVIDFFPKAPETEVENIVSGEDSADGHGEPGHAATATGSQHKATFAKVGKVKVDLVDTPEGIDVEFPWGRDVAAAVFRRGDFLWIIFDAVGEVDLSNFHRGRHYEIRDVEDLSTEDMTFIRFALGPRTLVTARPGHHAWRILLGETADDETKNIGLSLDAKDPDQVRISADVASPNMVHLVTDPEVGDEIFVVTAPGPAQGLIASRKYVDFLALASAQGLAIQPVADDLDVSIDEGTVSITKVGGLEVTGANDNSDLQVDEPAPQIAAVHAEETVGGHEDDAEGSDTSDEDTTFVEENTADEEGARFADENTDFVKFVAWRGDKKDGYYGTLARLNQDLNKALKQDRTQRRLDLARFYFAHGLLSEAVGALSIIATEDPGFTNTAEFIILKGATQQRMYRNRDALETLAHFSVKDDLGAAVWRGMAYEGLGFHKKARWELAKGLRRQADRYPLEWRGKFRLAQVKAMLGVNDPDDANTMWADIPVEALNDTDRAEAWLTKGKILNAVGEPAMALEYFRKVFPLTDGEMAHRARYNEAKMLHEVGELDADEVINRLEQLRYQWRGDDLELKVLQSLGDIYHQEKRYRDALFVMRVGFTFNPQHPISRDMRDRMGEIFQELYLNGKADSMEPAAAIALFYDFKELTPIGTKGDRMIRLLTERLVVFGLLDQAAELLEHQVKYRLRGTAQAQVAMRLALIQLKNKRPKEAFNAIRSTRSTGLTNKLRGQRRLIEARALADMGRHEHAVELLEDDVTREAEVLRASIYWDADNWPETGRIYEGLLEDAWGIDKTLDNETRASVMRMAIAYALINDKPALERIRRKFGLQMTASPDAQAFNIATGDMALQGVAFRDVLRRVNSVDTFEAFMSDFKKRFGDDGTLVN